MKNTLINRTVKGFGWSFIEIVLVQSVNLIITIIFARLLNPNEFGILSILLFFILISELISDGGISTALIRKKECTEKDYSTAFFTNVTISLFIYSILYFSAPLISSFFDKDLNVFIKVISLAIIIGAIGIIYRVQLTRKLDYKKRAIIKSTAVLFGSIIGIFLAYHRFGVWSLIMKIITQKSFEVLFFYLASTKKLKFIFSFNSFRNLFGFGSKLIVANLINIFFIRIYSIIIGKYFGLVTLGYYYQADRLGTLSSQSLSKTFSNVSYASLSKIKEDSNALRSNYIIILRCSMFIICPMMFFISGSSGTIITLLLGENWVNSIPFLRILAIYSMFYSINYFSKNIMNIKGKSSLVLKLEVFNKILILPVIIVGIGLGIIELLYGMLLISIIHCFIMGYFSGKLINYSLIQQIKDIISPITLGCLILSITYLLDTNYFGNIIFLFLIQFIVLLIIYYLIFRYSAIKDILKIYTNRD